jgi:hypothetical protein
MAVRDVIVRAREDLEELTGREVESVLGIERNDEGWHVKFEIVELSRTPSTTDVLGCYDVLVDGDGELLEYRRVKRYTRNQADGGDG